MKLRARAVNQIATFGTLGAKAVVRDAGRVLDYALPVLRCPVQADPVQPGRPVVAGAHAQDEAASKDRYEQEEEVRALVDLARPLEA